MLDRRTILGFAAGLMVALVVNFAWNDRRALREAAAQAQAIPANPGRFSVSSFGTSTFHGAYLLDTKEGKLWLVIQNGQPRYLGQVKE